MRLFGFLLFCFFLLTGIGCVIDSKGVVEVFKDVYTFEFLSSLDPNNLKWEYSKLIISLVNFVYTPPRIEVVLYYKMCNFMVIVLPITDIVFRFYGHPIYITTIRNSYVESAMLFSC